MTAILELTGQDVSMEVDTGAAVSLMAENTQQKLSPDAAIEPPQAWLSTHSAEVLKAVRVQGASQV